MPDRGATAVGFAWSASLEVLEPTLRIVTAIVTALVIAGAVAGLAPERFRTARSRRLALLTIGLTATAFVFLLQSSNIGLSAGGVVLGLAAGAIAVLVVTLYYSF